MPPTNEEKNLPKAQTEMQFGQRRGGWAQTSFWFIKPPLI